MNIELKEAMEAELSMGKKHFIQKEYAISFSYLERYHILSQAFYLPHLNSHWWMFKVGIKTLNAKEIVGQIVRMVGSVGSLFGKYPEGNTGGANVSPFKSMPIPDDLKPLLKNK